MVYLNIYQSNIFNKIVGKRLSYKPIKIFLQVDPKKIRREKEYSKKPIKKGDNKSE